MRIVNEATLICVSYPPLRINTYKLVRRCLNEGLTSIALRVNFACFFDTYNLSIYHGRVRPPSILLDINISRTRRIYSMTSSRASSYASLKSSGSNSPPLRHSNDSDDSLRALELTEGPILASSSRRGRSYSISGFDFQHDLLPLSTSLSEPETVHGESTEKNLGLFNGMF